MYFEPFIYYHWWVIIQRVSSFSTSNKPLDSFPCKSIQFLTSWWWVNIILLNINISQKWKMELNGNFRWKQVILQHVQHNRSITVIPLTCMRINSTLSTCILVHYICIMGILLLPFCSIFDQKQYLQTLVPSSTHAKYFVFKLSGLPFYSVWKTNY